MENDGLNSQFQSEQQLQNQYQRQVWKDRIYRFFYNIWPSVNRTLAFVFYHLMRIIRGFFRTALESIKGGG
ncbi:MAG: hypothetical protein Q7T54_01440 [Candidatus Levybacteria bacterium]|nr:hypothetical protein [Candidatus Levybacteria bacterium]